MGKLRVLRSFEQLQLRVVERIADEPQCEERRQRLDRIAGEGVNLGHDAGDRRDDAAIGDSGTIDDDCRKLDRSPIRRKFEGF